MIFHLDRSAGVNDMVMVKSLIDHGGALYLNNIHTECESKYQRPARSERPAGYWRQMVTQSPRSGSPGRKRRNGRPHACKWY
jgi:hypothetical protein